MPPNAVRSSRLDERDVTATPYVPFEFVERVWAVMARTPAARPAARVPRRTWLCCTEGLWKVARIRSARFAADVCSFHALNCCRECGLWVTQAATSSEQANCPDNQNAQVRAPIKHGQINWAANRARGDAPMRRMRISRAYRANARGPFPWSKVDPNRQTQNPKLLWTVHRP